MEPLDHYSGPPRRPIDTALFLLLSALLAGPVLWATYPPMADLPQHAAQISILLDWHDPALARASTYRVDLLTPYLLAYGLVWLLAQAMPLIWALKAVICAALIAFPWAVGRLLRRVGGPVELRWLAFPLALSYSFHWGFLNFLLATPLVVLFVELCIVYGQRPSRRLGALVALGAVGLFGCHAIIGGLGVLLGGGVVALRTSPRDWQTLLLPFGAPLPGLVLWWAAFRSDLPADGEAFRWHFGFHRVGDLLTQITGWQDRPLFLGVGLALLLLPFALGARPSREAWRWWPLLACTALGLLWPELFLTTSRVNGRFAVFVLPFLLAACDAGSLPRRRRAVTASAVILALMLLATQAAHTYLWQQQTRSFLSLLAQMPPGRSVLALIFLPANAYSPAPVNASMVHWYLVEKDGQRVDPALIDRSPFVVRYRDDALADLPPGFPWRVHEFDWYRHGGERYDLFVTLAPRDVGPRLFPPERVERVGKVGAWYLYRARSDRAVEGPPHRP